MNLDCTNPPKRILRKKQVRDITGVPNSTLHELIKAKLFPSSIKLGPRSVGFLEHEVQEWIEDRIAASRNLVNKEAA
jgi:prophage regulatory protein